MGCHARWENVTVDWTCSERSPVYKNNRAVLLDVPLEKNGLSLPGQAFVTPTGPPPIGNKCKVVKAYRAYWPAAKPGVFPQAKHPANVLGT